MKNGICPKCETREVHFVKRMEDDTSIPISWLVKAELGYYVCTKCGYTELFVQNEQLLPKIAEKYPKVHTYKSSDL